MGKINFMLLTNQSIIKKLNADFLIFVKVPRSKEEKQIEISIFDYQSRKIANYFQEKSDSLNIESFVKSIILEAISQQLLSMNDRVIVVIDEGVVGNYDTILFTMDIDRVLFRIGKFKLQELVENERVIDSTLQLAQEIAIEGREGKKVGTLFIIGQYEELSPYLKQLILNPFYGYSPEITNITNPNLKETIKNLAQLDGAFIINTDGTIISAGTYINVPEEVLTDLKIYPGWGTRHLAAAGITKATKSIAILVSESGGIVKVFKNGKLILRIKPY